MAQRREPRPTPNKQAARGAVDPLTGALAGFGGPVIRQFGSVSFLGLQSYSSYFSNNTTYYPTVTSTQVSSTDTGTYLTELPTPLTVSPTTTGLVTSIVGALYLSNPESTATFTVQFDLKTGDRWNRNLQVSSVGGTVSKQLTTFTQTAIGPQLTPFGANKQTGPGTNTGVEATRLVPTTKTYALASLAPIRTNQSVTPIAPAFIKPDDSLVIENVGTVDGGGGNISIRGGATLTGRLGHLDIGYDTSY